MQLIMETELVAVEIVFSEMTFCVFVAFLKGYKNLRFGS